MHSREKSNFEEQKQALTAISDAAQSYYANQESDDEHLTLMISDYLTWADASIEKEIEKISKINIDYIWVTDEYVIFWNNETKTYGILHSESANSVIKELKGWYDGMEYHKIERN